LPEGAPNDAPGCETVHGLANLKQQALLRRLDTEAVTAYEGSRPKSAFQFEFVG
jgi:hypothetical protein